MGNKIAFAEAVAAIVAHHAKLYELLLAVFPAYRGEGEMPPRESRASRILDCEKNDAHRLLEELATAALSSARRNRLYLSNQQHPLLFLQVADQVYLQSHLS